MKVVLFGGSGFIGRSLKDHFEARIAARQVSTNDFYWDPITRQLDPKELEGVDAVINLCGESVVAPRWSEQKKQNLFESRIRTTSLIVSTINEMQNPPKYLFNASAIGYYGSRGDEQLTEESSSGEGFLASLCQKWEEEASKAKCKVVQMRFGQILGKDGGLLGKILLPFKLCLGGCLGDGEQWMSWLAVEEVAPLIKFIYEKGIEGPVNFVSPEPVRNREFTETLAEVLRRPAFMNVSSVVLKTLFGEMADEMFLASQRVVPKVLEDHGYKFKYADLKSAL